MHAHSSKVEYQKNDCFIGSAFLAEKVRTPPRKFLWWCFFDDGLPKPPLCRKEAAKPRSTEFCVSLVGVDVPGDPRSAMFCFLSGYACFMLHLWFDNYSFFAKQRSIVFGSPRTSTPTGLSVCAVGICSFLPSHP